MAAGADTVTIHETQLLETRLGLLESIRQPPVTVLGRATRRGSSSPTSATSSTGSAKSTVNPAGGSGGGAATEAGGSGARRGRGWPVARSNLPRRRRWPPSLHSWSGRRAASSASLVSPDASCPTQRTRTYGRPQRLLNLSSSCTSCQAHDQASRKRRPPTVAGPHRRPGEPGVGVLEIRAQTLDVYLITVTSAPDRGMSRRYVLGAVRARTLKGPAYPADLDGAHPAESCDRKGSSVCSVSSSTSSPTSNCTSRQ